LIARLEEIGRALERTGAGVALLGLGSAGQALQRLDDHSDLDFFVIARAGSKRFFLDSLAWLETIQPVVFSFLNTADGYKLLFADGIFYEMAVFEPDELANIPYTQARVVWQEEGNALSFATDNKLPPALQQETSVAWLVGEIMKRARRRPWPFSIS